MPPLINDVSDTARWIAAVRAAESARPDALVHDPLAETLAGFRGAMIAAKLPWLATCLTEGGIVARTIVIDELIERTLREGAVRVINLAAGFDTRPYRLQVPSNTEWIEVDLPALIEEKNAITERHRPSCRLRRLGKDLASDTDRREVIDLLADQGVPTLAITEGLLAYLSEPQVRALSRDLAECGVTWWITDVYSSSAMRTLEVAVNGHLDKSPVSFRAPAEGLAFFTANGGWQPGEVASELATARTLGRLPLVMRPLSRSVGNRPKTSGKGNWIAITRLTHPNRGHASGC